MEVPSAPVEQLNANRKPRRGSYCAAALCWIWLLAMFGFMYYLRTRGDRAWLPTILIFSPRWMFAAPVAVLLPLALYQTCRLPCFLMVFTALFPLMGFCVGLHRFQSAPAGATQSIRIVTFNLHGIPLSEPALRDFLTTTHADVLAFEELRDRVIRADYPAGLTHLVRHGELMVASRFPIRVARVLAPETVVRYTLLTPAGPVDLIGVHLSSPHWALSDSIHGSTEGPQELARNIEMRATEARLLQNEIAQTSDRPLIIAGDFNLTPDSPLFTGNFSAMSDAWQCSGFGFGWTYFHQHAMVRIDHVLTNDLLWCKSCTVGPNLGSPHRPLIADLMLLHP